MFTDEKNLFFAATALVLLVTANVYAGERSREEVRAPISRGQAQQNAMREVKGGHIIDERFHDRWFKNDDYEFVIVDDATRYRIRVDAKTGKIVSVKKKAVFTDHLLGGERGRLPGNVISPQRVRAIAMEHAPQAVIVKMDRLMEYGRFLNEIESDRIVYDVEMQGNNLKIHLMVDGVTGNVLSYEEMRLNPAE